MAVDTASKRFSMMNFGTQPIQPLIIPDGTVASADMYHFLTLYSGISIGAPAAPALGGGDLPPIWMFIDG